MTRWLGVTTEENWKVCIKHGVWGASNDYALLMKEIKEGDEILVYLIKYRLAGIFKVTRGYFRSKRKLWKEGTYPHRIRITPVIHPKEPIDIEDWYNNVFQPKIGKAPQGYFQRAIRRFYDDTEHEFEMFKSLLKGGQMEAKEREQSWSFAELHDYIVYDMNEDIQANYQPIMLKVLLESGGKASKDQIIDGIRQFNTKVPRGGFGNTPVFGTLENKGIVTYQDDNYVLNIEDLTNDQRNELTVLAKWKIYDQPIPLDELINAFDKNKKLFSLEMPNLSEILKVRDEFVADYSPEKILQLELNEYVQGKGDPTTGRADHSTFCFRLERRVPWFGNIWGTPADKFGIYYDKRGRKYSYKTNLYGSPEEAFEAVKEEIVTVIKAGKQFSQDKDWNALAETLEGRKYNIERHVRSRILAIYYPEEFPQVHASDAIEKILLSLGVPESGIERRLFLNQGKLMEIKNNHSVMKNWSTIHFSHFIWMVVMERVARKDLKDKIIYRSESDPQLIKSNYFILRTQPNSQWQDREGEEYHFGTNVPRHSQITPGTRVIFDHNVNGQIEYLGSAIIEEVLEEDRKRTTPEGRSIIDKIAKLQRYENFSPPVIKDNEITKKIESIPGYNNQHSIRAISQEIYDMITNRAKIVTSIGWTFDVENVIDEVLGIGTSNELAIDRELVKRIIIHLKAGKNVILVGPPGVGKTALARKLLQVVGKRVINDENPLEAVASDEWTRYEVIGGIDINGKFQQGWVSTAVQSKRWLLIDEFNRANMNKAFGEMFLAIEYNTLTIRPTEKSDTFREVISIPNDFRMVCTMNDFDKNLLLTELSYGLISRFAFVSITPNVKDEPRVIEKRIKAELPASEPIYDSCKDQIDKYFEFINVVRDQRNIGIRTSIDVVKYLIAASTTESTTDDKWISLNNALCDYVLPQFDRLDKETIDHVYDASKSILATDHFESFNDELRHASERLQKAAGWLIKEDDK